MYSDQEIFLARKYATALLNVWGDAPQVDCAKDLWVAAIFFQRYGVMLWHQPEHVLVRVLEILGLNAGLFSSLLELLKRQHRLSLFPQIVAVFAKIYAQKNQFICVQVGYSHVMPKELAELYRAKITALFSGEVIYMSWKNKALIAGVTVQGAGLFWECSVRRRLSLYAQGLIGSN